MYQTKDEREPEVVDVEMKEKRSEPVEGGRSVNLVLPIMLALIMWAVIFATHVK